MLVRHLAVLGSGLFAALPAQSSRAWPHWRGPARDGISSETEWSSVGRPEPVWRTEVGLGYSNVAIQDGRLFTLGFDEASGEDRLVCLDAVTGEARWRNSWPAKIIANFHGGGSLPTPAVDGDVVYVTTREGRAMALRVANGEEVWHRDYTEELGLQLTFHGYSASPVALPDRLIVGLGGVVTAVDKRTGDILWRTDDYGDGGYATPVPFELDGRARLCVYFGLGPVVLDTNTGKELSRFDWKPKAGGVNVGTPIVFGRKVFVSSAYNQGAGLLELDDDAQPQLLWRSRRMRNKVSGCVLWQDHIYGFDESVLRCLDLQGEQTWYQRGLGMGALTLAGGRLIVLTSKGELIVAAASPKEFHELSRRKVLDGGVYWTNPVLLNGYIYCRNSLGQLVSLDHRPSAEPAPAIAASPRSSEALPAAASLFEGHARAVGGDKLRARESLHVDGTVESAVEGITRSPVTIDWAAPNKWQLTFEIEQIGRVQRAFDGEVGWNLDPVYGNRLLEDAELRAARELQRLHAPLEWKAIYPEIETTGRQRFANRDCWVVTAKSTGGAVRRLFFDASDRRLVGHDADGESMVVFEEWRAFDGIALPARTRIIAPDTGSEEVQVITTAKWDAVDAGVFERPDSVRRMLWTPERIAAANRAARVEFGRYLGTYTGDMGQGPEPWKVVVAHGKLAIDYGDGKPREFEKTAEPHRFLMPGGENFQIEFRVDDDGEATGLAFEFGGRAFVFARTGR